MLKSIAIKYQNDAFARVFYQETVNGTYNVFVQKDHYLIRVREPDAFIGVFLSHPYYFELNDAEEILKQFKYKMICGPCMGDSEIFNKLFPDIK